MTSSLPLGSFVGAFEFIFTPQESNVTGGKKVGGFDKVLELMLKQLEVTVLALAIALVIALPLGLYLGHRGKGEQLAVGLGNAGRAIPELAVIALVAVLIGVGLANVAPVLAILGIPPILTNSYVGVQQVDRATVDAARGIGMSEPAIIRKVELPIAIPTVMGGIRSAAIAILATATIAPLAGVETLGDFIINRNVYGENGLLAGAILVALLALAIEGLLALLQRRLTSDGLKVKTA
ncbi:MAG TPA: ABC transporter permease subunit [Solirubrobacterales bacterium]|jgi:osmoprotectant transport system permease protein|nr:ABC transporter permease subunit [Solirubrobacterales bacterium]